MKHVGFQLREMSASQPALAKVAARRYAMASEADMQRWELLAADYRSTCGSGADDEVQLSRWAGRMGLDPFDYWAVRRILGVRVPEEPTVESTLLSLLADLEGAVQIETERRIETDADDYAALESIEIARRRVVAFVRKIMASHV